MFGKLESILKKSLGTIGLAAALITSPQAKAQYPSYSLKNYTPVFTNFVNRKISVSSNYLAWVNGNNLYALDLKNGNRTLISNIAFAEDIEVVGSKVAWTKEENDYRKSLHVWDENNGIRLETAVNNADAISATEDSIIYKSGEEFFLLPIGGAPKKLLSDEHSVRWDLFLAGDNKLKYWNRNQESGFDELNEFDLNTSSNKVIFSSPYSFNYISHFASSGKYSAWVILNQQSRPEVSTIYQYDGERTTIINTFQMDTTGLAIEDGKIAWVLWNGEIDYWTPRTGISKLANGTNTEGSPFIDVMLKSGKIFIDKVIGLDFADIKRRSPLNPVLSIEDTIESGRKCLQINRVYPGTRISIYGSQDLNNWELINQEDRGRNTSSTASLFFRVGYQKYFFKASVENLPDP